MSLSMGTLGSSFLRAFFIKSSVFQRHDHISRILFLCGNASSEQDQPRRNNGNEGKKKSRIFFMFFFLLWFKYILLIFQRFFAHNVQHTFWKISLPPSHDQHRQP